jgi:monofunctional biosynthetic peptidoglycan transglycosylase
VLRRILVLAAALAGVALLLIAVVVSVRVSAVEIAPLASRTPPATALVRTRAAEARAAHRAFGVDQRTVPYDRVAPILRRAVLIAEDDAFFTHGGLDWNEIRASARRDLAARRFVRGGSTITQQLAKNLFLAGDPALLRKLEEVGIAMRLERALSKRRIFELYLNVIEWGDGIYGVEAAAQRYFGVSAEALDPRQACLLAAVIINPRRYSVIDPGPRIERRVRIIASRLRRRGALDTAGYLAAISRTPPEREGLLERMFGGLFGGGNDGDLAPVPDDSLIAPQDSLERVEE